MINNPLNVEPKGDSMKPYQVEGIGYDFVPEVLNTKLVDHWVKVDDRESFRMARRLIKEEGILCGGSSGSALAGAVKIIKRLSIGKGKRLVVVLPDSLRNYMSKFLSDDWMLIHGFMDPEEMALNRQLRDPHLDLNSLKPVAPVDEKTKTKAIVRQLDTHPHVPVLGSQDEIIGVVSKTQLAQKYFQYGETILGQAVRRHMHQEFIILKDLKDLQIYLGTGYPVFVQRSSSLYYIDPMLLLPSN